MIARAVGHTRHIPDRYVTFFDKNTIVRLNSLGDIGTNIRDCQLLKFGLWSTDWRIFAFIGFAVFLTLI